MGDAQPPSLLSVARLEAAAALRGDGLLRSTSVVTVLGMLVLAVARRLNQGALHVDDSTDVVITVLTAVMPPAITAVAAARLVDRRHRAVERDLFLLGWTPGLRAVPGLVDGMILGVMTVLASVAFQAITVGGLAPGPVTRLVVCALVASGSWAGLGLIIASVAADRLAALGLLLAGHLVGLLLWWTALEFSVASVGQRVWPWTAPLLLFVDRPGSWPLSAGVSLTVAVLGVVAAGRSGTTRWRSASTGRVRGRGLVRSLRARRADFHPARRAGLALVVALCAGLVVPTGLRTWLPWWLQPRWLSQVESHQASTDIALAWARSVRSGGPLHGPEASMSLREPVPPIVRDLRSTDFDHAELASQDGPSVVVLTAAGGEATYVCLVEEGAGWRVAEVRTQPDCPVTP